MFRLPPKMLSAEGMALIALGVLSWAVLSTLGLTAAGVALGPDQAKPSPGPSFSAPPPSNLVVPNDVDLTQAPRTPTFSASPTPKPKITTAKPRSKPTTKRPTPPPPPEESDAYYANCVEVHDAGAAPLYRGDPGYRRGLDRDNDGVACE